MVASSMAAHGERRSRSPAPVRRPRARCATPNAHSTDSAERDDDAKACRGAKEREDRDRVVQEGVQTRGGPERCPEREGADRDVQQDRVARLASLQRHRGAHRTEHHRDDAGKQEVLPVPEQRQHPPVRPRSRGEVRAPVGRIHLRVVQYTHEPCLRLDAPVRQEHERHRGQRERGRQADCVPVSRVSPLAAADSCTPGWPVQP